MGCHIDIEFFFLIFLNFYNTAFLDSLRRAEQSSPNLPFFKASLYDFNIRHRFQRPPISQLPLRLGRILGGRFHTGRKVFYFDYIVPFFKQGLNQSFDIEPLAGRVPQRIVEVEPIHIDYRFNTKLQKNESGLKKPPRAHPANQVGMSLTVSTIFQKKSTLNGTFFPKIQDFVHHATSHPPKKAAPGDGGSRMLPSDVSPVGSAAAGGDGNGGTGMVPTPSPRWGVPSQEATASKRPIIVQKFGYPTGRMSLRFDHCFLEISLIFPF